MGTVRPEPNLRVAASVPGVGLWDALPHNVLLKTLLASAVGSVVPSTPHSPYPAETLNISCAIFTVSSPLLAGHSQFETMVKKGTIAVEEAIIDPASVWTLAGITDILAPGANSDEILKWHEQRLLDIHDKRLASMDAEGVEYMLLSLTSPGCQGQHDPAVAEKMATVANDYLASEVAKNPARFGGLAAVSMHDPEQAAKELTRAVKELGFFGGLINDYQSIGADGLGKAYFDDPRFDPFWKTAQDLDVPIYFHPRWPVAQELVPGTQYGSRRHLLGAAVQFHLDLSFHIYSICSSGKRL